jgi:hypothetical protein
LRCGTHLFRLFKNATASFLCPSTQHRPSPACKGYEQDFLDRKPHLAWV